MSNATPLTMLSVVASCAAASCVPLAMQNESGPRLANTSWIIASVSGDRLSKTGSTIRFGSKTFEAKLPCSSVVGEFVQTGDVVRMSKVRTIAGSCTPTGQERYFAGKISQGEVVSLTPRGVTLQIPPDYIELTRR